MEAVPRLKPEPSIWVGRNQAANPGPDGLATLKRVLKGRASSNSKRLNLIEHCIESTASPLDLRIAALILLLFGQPVSKIPASMCLDLRALPEGLHLRLATHPRRRNVRPTPRLRHRLRGRPEHSPPQPHRGTPANPGRERTRLELPGHPTNTPPTQAPCCRLCREGRTAPMSPVR
jgi:hypothetical protein